MTAFFPMWAKTCQESMSKLSLEEQGVSTCQGNHDVAVATGRTLFLKDLLKWGTVVKLNRHCQYIMNYFCYSIMMLTWSTCEMRVSLVASSTGADGTMSYAAAGGSHPTRIVLTGIYALACYTHLVPRAVMMGGAAWCGDGYTLPEGISHKTRTTHTSNCCQTLP